MRLEVLGHTRLSAAGFATAIRLTPSERKILAILAAYGSGGVTVHRLLEDVWGEDPPESARSSLHNHLARLRQRLPDGGLRWSGRAYVLAHPGLEIDVERFVEAAERAVKASVERACGDVVAAGREALRWWPGGQPFADVDAPGATVLLARQKLIERRAEVREHLARALVEVGDDAAAISELTAQVAEAPDREAGWQLLMAALARSGRRIEALDVYQRAREHFVGILGLDAPPALEQLQQLVLTGASTLRPAPAAVEVHGREELLAKLLDLLATGHSLAVTGEGGVGKTTLVQRAAVAWHEQGRRAVVVACQANPWTALQPVVELLAAMRVEIGALQAPAGPALQRLLGAAGPVAGTSPDSVVREIVAVLRGVTDHVGPLLVVMDDAQHVGPTTGRALRAIVEALPGVRLAVVARRVQDVPHALQEVLVELEVGPLDQAGLRALVAARHPDASVPDSLSGWLHRVSGGNPFFAVAVLEDLERRRVLDAAATGSVPSDVVVPGEAREVIEAAFLALRPEARLALEVAAVLDDPITDALVGTCADPAALVEAQEARLLDEVGSGRYRFRHELVRATVDARLPRGRKQEIHHVLASSSTLSPSQRATHAYAARELDLVAARHQVEEAAVAAFETMAYEEAADWYDRAAALQAACAPGDESAHLLMRLEAAIARRYAGLPGHAEMVLDVAERATELGGAISRRATLAALELGETSEAGPLQQRAAALADAALANEHDPAAKAAIAAAASLVHSMSGEPDLCRRLFLDAWALIDEEDATTGGLVLPYAYMATGHVDDWGLRARAAAQLCRHAEASGHPVVAFEAGHLMFSVALQRGDGQMARSSHERMRALLDVVGDAGRRWQFQYQEAAVAYLDGRLDDVEVAAAAALETGSGVAANRALGAYAGQLLELRRTQGRLDELTPLLNGLVGAQTVLPAWKAAASFVLAEDDAVRSAALSAELAADRFAALPRDFAWLASVQLLARAAVARGDVASGAAITEALKPYASWVVWQGTCAYGPVAITLAELALLRGDDAEAARMATSGLELAERLGAPVYAAEARRLSRPSAGG